MFKKKKDKEVVKNPPRILRETKNYRFVMRQMPCMTDQDGKITAYQDELVMEERDASAMEEPYWKIYVILNPYGGNSYSQYVTEHNRLVKVVRDFLGLE